MSSPPSLLSLPTEIRAQIITHVLQSPLSPTSLRSRQRLQGLRDASLPERDFRSARFLPVYVPPYSSSSPLLTYPESSLLLASRQLRAETLHLRTSVRRGPPVLDVLFVRHLGLLPVWVTPPNRGGAHHDEVFVNVRMVDEWSAETMPEPEAFASRNVASWQVNWTLAVVFSLVLLDRIPDSLLPGSPDAGVVLKEQSERGGGASKDGSMPAPYTINRVSINVTDPYPAQAQALSPQDPLLFADDVFPQDPGTIPYAPDNEAEPVTAASCTYRVGIDVLCALELMATEPSAAACGDNVRSGVKKFENHINGNSYGAFDVAKHGGDW